MIFKIVIVVYTFLLFLVFGIVDLTNIKLNGKSVIISILVVAIYVLLIIFAGDF